MTDRIEAHIVQRIFGPVVGKRVLDVGCGDEELSVRLAQPGAEVTGVDADLRMLAAARSRAAQAGQAIEFIEGDVRQLPFSDQTFDIVVAVTVLCFVSDPERAISEITRVLKTDGRLIIGELGRYSLWAVKRRIADGSAHEHGEPRHSCRPARCRRLSQPPVSLSRKLGVRSTIRRAIFARIGSRHSTPGFPA